MIILSYGGGTNSTAMLIGLKEREIVPDVILFADTGGEKPNTYAYLSTMDFWLKQNGFPQITKVTIGGAAETLEQNCLRRKALPSVAYGFKTCSQRWKMEPQEIYLNKNGQAQGEWIANRKVTRCIGFDADEPQRAKVFDDPKYQNWYPLIEWNWGRKECVEAIERAGLPLPGKSSCFFCPSSSANEVKWLAAKHPDLYERAIAMENNAELTQVSGLGRSYKWSDVLATDDMFADSFIDIACGCYDG